MAGDREELGGDTILSIPFLPAKWISVWRRAFWEKWTPLSPSPSPSPYTRRWEEWRQSPPLIIFAALPFSPSFRLTTSAALLPFPPRAIPLLSHPQPPLPSRGNLIVSLGFSALARITSFDGEGVKVMDGRGETLFSDSVFFFLFLPSWWLASAASRLPF